MPQGTAQRPYGAQVRGPLTDRQREVLTWIAAGKSAREIAIILGITKRTVYEHARATIQKGDPARRPQHLHCAHQVAENRRLRSDVGLGGSLNSRSSIAIN